MNILFVCTGNTCRSPMAEFYLNSLHLPGVTAKSAGIYADGSPISIGSAEALKEIGVNADNYLSVPLSLQLINQADKIYCMSPSHREVLLSLGVNKEKVFLLKDGGVSDPFGGNARVYRKCRDEITHAVNKIFGVSPLTVSYLTENDIRDIAELEGLCFSTPWSEEAIKESLNGINTFTGVKVNGKLAGYLSFYQIAGECYINNIAVNPNYRRQGVAKALLCELMHLCVSGEYEFVSLEVRSSNSAAINLYSAFGFKEEGRRKNYYSFPTEDAVILTRRFKECLY